ncbi:MAG: hypothetical protein HS129_13845 [Leptospiraceae bacterium]|nr:hypothetical protein [Leptospiraceae bacterium]
MNPQKFIRNPIELACSIKYMDEFNRRTTGLSMRKYLNVLLNRYRNVILWGL